MKSLRYHEVRTYEDREIVVREGEESREMFVIRDGQVEIYKQHEGREMRLALLTRGSFFGEMSLLEGLPRSASARSVGNSRLVVLRPGSLLILIRRDPTFAFELLQQMSSRIRYLNERVVNGAGNGVEALGRSPLLTTTLAEYAPPPPPGQGAS